MDDSFLVRRLEGVGDLQRDVQRLVERNRAVAQSFGQRRPLDQFHHEEIGADIVERADVRMIQRGNGSRFPLEPIGKGLP